MSNTDQAPEPSMEEILSSIRRIISDDNDPSSAEEGAVAEAPEELPEPVVEDPPVQDKAEPETEQEPEPEPESEIAEDVAEPEPASDDDDDDIFELTKVVEIEEPVIDEDPADDQPDMSEFEVETTEGETDAGMEVADCGADVEDDIEFVDVDTGEPEVMALPELGPEPVLENEIPEEAEVADRLVSEGVGVAAAASFGDLANTLLSRGNNASTLEELVQEMLRPLLKDWLDTNLPTLVEKLVSEEIERIARRGR